MLVDEQNWKAQMDAVNFDLNEKRARVDATSSMISSRKRVETSMMDEISTMRLDTGDVRKMCQTRCSRCMKNRTP